MNTLRFQLIVLYGFLAAVAGFSVDNIWSLQTNPFVSYLGAGRWFYLLLDIGAIAASALTVRALMLRAKAGPSFALLVAGTVLVAYLGSKVLFFALFNAVPVYRVVGLPAIAISVFAVASIIVLRTKGFIEGYARGR
jgi:hypothetical protein